MKDIDLLKEFLEFPRWTSDPVFDKFKTIDNHVYREADDIQDGRRFLFVNGQKEKKVVLVAHADAAYYHGEKHFFEVEDGCFIAVNEARERTLLGADDRAECAILWALKDSGHSILVTDAEEFNLFGTTWLVKENPDIVQLLNQHQFMIQLDRRYGTDFVCVKVGSDEFRDYIRDNTNYFESKSSTHTDICLLCTDICGVNISVGYYEAHTVNEKIDYNQWQHTLNMARRLLSRDLPRFEL